MDQSPFPGSSLIGGGDINSNLQLIEVTPQKQPAQIFFFPHT